MRQSLAQHLHAMWHKTNAGPSSTPHMAPCPTHRNVVQSQAEYLGDLNGLSVQPRERKCPHS